MLCVNSPFLGIFGFLWVLCGSAILFFIAESGIISQIRKVVDRHKDLLIYEAIPSKAMSLDEGRHMARE